MFKEYFSVPWYQRVIMAFIIGSVAVSWGLIRQNIASFPDFYFKAILPSIVYFLALYGLFSLVYPRFLNLGFDETKKLKFIVFFFCFFFLLIFVLANGYIFSVK